MPFDFAGTHNAATSSESLSAPLLGHPITVRGNMTGSIPEPPSFGSGADNVLGQGFRPSPTATDAPRPVDSAQFFERIGATVARMAPTTSMLNVAKFITLQEWEGFVDAINPDRGDFSVRLRPIRGVVTDTFEQHLDEVEFKLEDLSDVDQQKIVMGRRLRWSLGYEFEGRTRRNAYRITFPR